MQKGLQETQHESLARDQRDSGLNFPKTTTTTTSTATLQTSNETSTGRYVPPAKKRMNEENASGSKLQTFSTRDTSTG